jgi:alkylation response protein AidB-like acyl-CoA dehydrogenase
VIVHGSEELKASTLPRVVTDGMTLFLTDLDRDRVEIRPIPKMGREAVDSNELFIDNLLVPEEDRVGEEGKGFKYLLDGLNPERILIALAALGLGRAAVRRAVAYGAPISQEMILNYVGEHVLGMPRSY